jgi:hypothetical protein
MLYLLAMLVQNAASDELLHTTGQVLLDTEQLRHVNCTRHQEAGGGIRM